MRRPVYLAAFAVLALVSCQEEKNISPATGSNEVAFVLQETATRSADAAYSAEEGISLTLEMGGDIKLHLEESIVDLNGFASETRGTPAYTENVGYLYKDKLGVSTGTVDASYARLSDKPSADGGWEYQYRYDVDIWPDETTDVQFYLRMPTDMDAHGVGTIGYSEGVTTVTYVSPVTAADQEDILFGAIKMSHRTYMGHYPKGAPVTLYHALTGIKFALANDAAEMAKIQIHKISFIGLQNKGTFTNTCGRAGASVIAWTQTSADDGNVIYQEFEEGDLVTYDARTHADNNFAPSFFAGGTKQNLNKADASYTFWLVPQTIENSDAILRIEYTMSGKDESMDIRLGDLKVSNWQAGQIRTYTFKLDEVNLKIEDQVEIKGTADDGYKGSKKSGVKITNTGNVKAFFRAAIVGQWLDATNNPVFGFTDEINRLYLVESWYEDQFGENGTHKHGTFSGLAGYDQANPYNNWTLCEDGYYYYRYPVDPGDATEYPLFTDYVTAIAPKAQLAGNILETAEMHFELEIATQAISAVKLDGTPYEWDAAWEHATGTKPVKK